MGRILPVDVLQILALAWDHPLIAGACMLLFTPPFFPVLVFFSPLLMSTTLCAVALVSVGHQIEDVSKREREIMGWNARVVEGDLLSARERTIRRRRVPGEGNWLNWLGEFEPGSVWQTPSMFMEDIKDEKLSSEFRVDEGGIAMVEEDRGFHRQQIEAFHQFERSLSQSSFSFKTGAVVEGGLALREEDRIYRQQQQQQQQQQLEAFHRFERFGDRSFSFRTGAAVAARIGAIEEAPRDSSMVPFEREPQTTPGSQIPPMFLYSLKTGGTGGATRAKQPPSRMDRAVVRPKVRQEDGLASFGNRFNSGSFTEPEPVGYDLRIYGSRYS